MKLSIITALYNTKDLIEECIHSVYLNNSLFLSEFEVIVINDGSTDGSEKVIERLQKEYTNLILINKENGGQSTARNIGFKKAKGEYIFCLDSDDTVNAQELIKALKYAEDNKLDMLPIAFKTFDEKGKVLPLKKDNYSVFHKFINGGQFMRKFIVSGTMWRYFYKTSLIRQNNLKLTEGVFHEDEEFVIKYLSYVRKTAYQKHLVYNYLQRSESTVNKKSINHRKKLIWNLITVAEHLDKHRKEFMNEDIEIYNGISKKLEQIVIKAFLNMKSNNLKNEEVNSYINKLKISGLYPLCVKNNNLKFKVAAFFFNNKYFLRFLFRK